MTETVSPDAREAAARVWDAVRGTNADMCKTPSAAYRLCVDAAKRELERIEREAHLRSPATGESSGIVQVREALKDIATMPERPDLGPAGAPNYTRYVHAWKAGVLHEKIERARQALSSLEGLGDE